MRKVAIAMAVVAMGLPLAQADDAVKCAARPNLPASCYQVRGRLASYAGGPASDKIWVVGTHRMLAVYDRTDGSAIMPKALRTQLTDIDGVYAEIFADYQVCPLEKEIPGHEGHVCVESAKNIRVEYHQTVNGEDRFKDAKRMPDTAPGTLTD